MQFSILPRRSYVIDCDMSEEEFTRHLKYAFYSEDDVVPNQIGGVIQVSYGIESFVITRKYNKSRNQSEAYIIGNGFIKTAENGTQVHIDYLIENATLMGNIMMGIIGFLVFLLLGFKGIFQHHVNADPLLALPFAIWGFGARWMAVYEIKNLHHVLIEALKMKVE